MNLLTKFKTPTSDSSIIDNNKERPTHKEEKVKRYPSSPNGLQLEKDFHFLGAL